MRLAHSVAAHTPASAVSAARAKDRSWALRESMELASPSPPNAGVEARSMREGALRLNAERPQNAGTARIPEELPGTDARGQGSPTRCVLRQRVAGWRRAKSCAAAVSAAARLRSTSGATRLHLGAGRDGRGAGLDQDLRSQGRDP